MKATKELSTSATSGTARLRSGRVIPAANTNRCDFAEHQIAERAYSYWEARNFETGCPEKDWYRAIDELTHERD